MVQPFAVVADGRRPSGDQNRLWNNFVNIKMPLPDSTETISIYSSLLRAALAQTNASQNFKDIVEV